MLSIAMIGFALGMSTCALAEVSTRNAESQSSNTKAQYLLKQLSAEKANLQGEIAKLKSEIEQRDRKIDKLNKKLGARSKSLVNKNLLVDRYQKTVTAQRDQMTETREKFTKLVEKYRELAGALKLMESDRTDMQKKMAEQSEAIEKCKAKNDKLGRIAENILKEYKEKDVWDALMQKEPVTQLKRVEVENYVEENSYKIDKLKIVDNK
jgi:peptidoglycan hydrolase CwlO-like protein